MCNQYMEYLNNYFGGKEIKPICREERQFALFLYNKILNLVNKRIYDEDDINLLKNLGLDENAKILQVYYEVTFMRDFLDKEKNNSNSKFNKFLFDYVLEKFGEGKGLSHLFNINDNNISEIIESQNLTVFPSKEFNNYVNVKNNYKVIPDINYGSNAKDGEKTDILPCFIRNIMRSMMNSKPDIGIIYEKQGKKYLKFIECKYLSPEGYVKLIKIKVYQYMKKANLFKDFSFILPQTVIQYYIADFICNKLLDNTNLSPDIPSLVKFGDPDSNCDEYKDYENDKSYFYIPNNLNLKESNIANKQLVPDCLKKQIFQIKD